METKPQKIKIEVKHFYAGNSPSKEDALRTLKAKGLKRFDSLDFQFGMIPEGVHYIDTTHMFDNQYNTFGKGKNSGYRVFEFCEKLITGNAGGLQKSGTGYYISKGIEQIRALQSRIKVCGYCGAQYIDSDQQWCEKCVGSEYLKEDNYQLLELVPLLEKSKHKYSAKVPARIRQLIKQEQKKTRTRLLEKSKADKLVQLKEDIEAQEVEYAGFKWLIERDIPFDNCIYYTHSKEFCFGWRNSLDTKEQGKLKKKLKGFPYKVTFK